MKTGLENKRNVTILVILLIILTVATVYFVRSVFVGGSNPAARPAPEASAQPGPTSGGEHAAQKLPSLAKLDPTLHPEVMAGAESLEYTGTGRNIFSMNSAPVKIEKPIGPIRPEAQKMIATGPPPPPPIDLKFFGYEAAGGAKKAFLLHNDDVFIASEGDVVDHHYKIIKINPLSIQVTDLLYNHTQTLPLSQS
ncbi:MAG TPA: hypothetical protein VHU89_15305 [Acidobacteriaceae bacterium]|jgi:hypothetical protein|nr:hypothetical protein [Acidobacteriaceae bacterium]